MHNNKMYRGFWMMHYALFLTSIKLRIGFREKTELDQWISL